MNICDLLIFVGCLVLHIQCQKICKKDEYTVVTSNGSFVRCLNCATCHPGYGLDPPCGSLIPDPPHPDCIACPAGKFSDELDSAPCHSCQRCAEHEIVTAPCTNQSDRICSGTCKSEYFYSKKDSTHSCKKCSYCCLDGRDEEIPECANQRLEASKRHCHPRPDKDCNPGSSLESPTDRQGGTEASENGGLPNATIIGIVFGVVSPFIVGALATGICLYLKTRKKPGAQTAAQIYAQNGPAAEPTVQLDIPRNTELFVTPAGSHEGLRAGTAERQDMDGANVNSGANLNQNTTTVTVNEQASQNATCVSLPRSSLNEPAAVATSLNLNAAEDNTTGGMPGGDPAAPYVVPDAAPPTGTCKVTVNDKDVANDLKDTSSGGPRCKLSRQFSKDSQRSGDGADGESGRRKRSPSSSSFTETLKRKLSKKDEPLVGNEEYQNMDESQGAITIIAEPSSQKIKEGSKVELVFKCKARGNSKLTYQWYKDGAELQGKDEGTLVLKSVTLPDFGWYNCVASCPSDRVESSLAELNVTPHDGRMYKCLKDIDISTRDQIEDLLTQKSYGSGGWRQVAFKYGMDQLKIKSLEKDPEAGKKTLEYLGATNPDLTVYDLCKTLKEYKRLDIVKELRGHLSVPSSSKVYV